MQIITVTQTIECRAFIINAKGNFYQGQIQVKHIEIRAVGDGKFANSTVSLNPQEIQEFKLIVKKIKDIDLTDEEAEDQALRMVRLALLVKEKLLLEVKIQKVNNNYKDENGH
jgi:hypothetical protein